MKQQLVVGFLFSSDQKRIVVIHKNRPEHLAGRVIVPGGKVEPGESPLQALIREWKEETDVQINRWTEFLLHQTPELDIFGFMHFSTARVNRCKTITDELIEVVEVAKLPSNMLPNARWMIHMALSFSAGEHASRFAVQEVYA